MTPLASAATPLEDDLDNSESEDDPSKNEGKGRSKDKDQFSRAMPMSPQQLAEAPAALPQLCTPVSGTGLPTSYEGKGTEQSAVADIEAFIEEEVSKGLAMLDEGDDAMRTNLRVAYDRYIRGLQSLLSLDESHPKVIALKQKIAKYVTSAEIVYEALEVKKKPAKAVTGLTAGAASTKVAGEVKVKKKPPVLTEAMELPTEPPTEPPTEAIFLREAPVFLREAPWRRSSPPLVLTEAKCPRH